MISKSGGKRKKSGGKKQTIGVGDYPYDTGFNVAMALINELSEAHPGKVVVKKSDTHIGIMVELPNNLSVAHKENDDANTV